MIVADLDLQLHPWFHGTDWMLAWIRIYLWHKSKLCALLWTTAELYLWLGSDETCQNNIQIYSKTNSISKDHCVVMLFCGYIIVASTRGSLMESLKSVAGILCGRLSKFSKSWTAFLFLAFLQILRINSFRLAQCGFQWEQHKESSVRLIVPSLSH